MPSPVKDKVSAYKLMCQDRKYRQASLIIIIIYLPKTNDKNKYIIEIYNNKTIFMLTTTTKKKNTGKCNVQKAIILGIVIMLFIKQLLSDNKYFSSLSLSVSVVIKSFKYDDNKFHKEPILFLRHSESK